MPPRGRAQALKRRLTLDGDDELTPILLAVSDNGSQIDKLPSTRRFMAMVAIAQHSRHARQHAADQARGRVPGRNTQDASGLACWQSPIPLSLGPNSTVCAPNTTTSACTPQVGYVTPLDEHTGRGPAIRTARQKGLRRAARQRLAYNRKQRDNQTNQEDHDDV